MTVEEGPIPGTYRVFYWVNLEDPMTPQCDCRSGCLSDRVCLHIRAAQDFRDGEPVQHWRDK